MKNILAVLIFSFMIFVPAIAQDERIKFGVVGRALQENNKLDKSDTVNIDRLNRGRLIVDLGVKANPLKNTEIQSIVRFGSELGGFYGGGSTIEIRRLFVKGLIANVVGYEVGDLYLQLSPFTFYNTPAEGAVNEATLFKDLRSDIVNYENFYFNNSWWQQGAHVDGALNLGSTIFNKVKADAFIVRNRVSPTHRFHAGSRLAFTNNEKYLLAFNYVNLFDNAASHSTESALSNQVASAQASYKFQLGNLDLTLSGEGGYSWLNFSQPLDTNVVRLPLPERSNDVFFTGGAAAKIKRLSFKASYRYVGPGFRSAGAQTKRIDFSKTPSTFMAVANDPYNKRSVNQFDLTRDYSVYNRIITPILMSYDPRLSNALPYGEATPNRQGISLNLSYKDSANVFYSDATAHILSDIAGNGSDLKRNFQVYRLSAGLNIHHLLQYKKQVSIYGGVQYESTARKGTLAAVDLTSSLMDAGIDIEIAKKLFLIGGAKVIFSKGNEFILPLDQYNQYGIPVAYATNGYEQLYGAGVKYVFSEDIYLTVQDQLLKIEDKVTNRNYSINQVLLMFLVRL